MFNLEAGKLALNLTRSNTLNMTPIKRFQVGTKKGPARKLITIRADQLIGQHSTPMMSKGPNILKRASVETKSGNKIFLSSIGNANSTIPSFTATKNTLTPVKVVEYSIYYYYYFQIEVRISFYLSFFRNHQFRKNPYFYK